MEGWAFDGIWPKTQMMGSDVPVWTLRTPKNQFRYHKEQYNQDNRWSNSCTLASAIGCVSDNHWIVYTDREAKEMYQEAVLRGLDPSVWRYLYKAVDLVVERTNKNRKTMLQSTTCKVRSKEYKLAMVLWYSLATGYGGNRAYNTDRDDGVIDNWKYGDPTYYHAIRHTINRQFQVNVVDNYVWRRHNVYRNPMVEEILNTGNHFNWAFIIYDPLDRPSKTAHRLRMIAMRGNLDLIQ